jgi:hypothetical protein
LNQGDKSKIITYVDYLEKELGFLPEYEREINWKVYESQRSKRLEMEPHGQSPWYPRDTHKGRTSRTRGPIHPWVEPVPARRSACVSPACAKPLRRRQGTQAWSSWFGIERWVESLINATLDISKMVLTIGREEIPETSREVLFRLGSHVYGNEEEAGAFSELARIRNTLAHRYLDMK